MKNIIAAVFAFICMACFVNAQVKVPDKALVDAFLKSKTYIVLEENPFSAFNTVVNDRIKDLWTLTPFEVISSEEFEKKMHDSKSSFLFMSQAQMGKGEMSNYFIMNLVMGDASGNINKMPELCVVPVSYDEVDPETYEYRFPALIKFIDYFIRYTQKNPGKDIRQIVSENSSELRNYGLWLVGSDLAPEVNTVEKIRKIYPYPVKIVTTDDIEKAVNEGNTKVAILHKVGPEETKSGSNTVYKFIITVKEGKPLYFGDHKTVAGKPDAFLEEDFKSMAK